MFIHCLKQAKLAPLPLSKLSSDWLPLPNTSAFTGRADMIVEYLLLLASFRSKSRKKHCKKLSIQSRLKIILVSLGLYTYNADLIIYFEHLLF